MKTYKEISDNVLRRRDEYLLKKKRRDSIIIKTASSVFGTAAAALIGIMIYNSTLINDIRPDPSNETYNVIEETACETSSEEKIEALETHTEAIVSPTDASETEKDEPTVQSTEKVSPAVTAAASSANNVTVTTAANVSHKTTVNEHQATSVTRKTTKPNGTTTKPKKTTVTAVKTSRTTAKTTAASRATTHAAVQTVTTVRPVHLTTTAAANIPDPPKTAVTTIVNATTTRPRATKPQIVTDLPYISSPTQHYTTAVFPGHNASTETTTTTTTAAATEPYLNDTETTSVEQIKNN